MDLSLQDLLAQTKLFVHGSTVVDNIVLTRDGSQGRVDHHPGLRGYAPDDARRLWSLGRADRRSHQASGEDQSARRAWSSPIASSALPSASTTRAKSSCGSTPPKRNARSGSWSSSTRSRPSRFRSCGRSAIRTTNGACERWSRASRRSSTARCPRRSRRFPASTNARQRRLSTPTRAAPRAIT